MNATAVEAGFCRGCAYPLHGLIAADAGYRCPECGRSFDPHNPATFLRHRHNRLLRWLATPPGWPTVALSLVAATAMLLISRCSITKLEPSTAALGYYLQPIALKSRSKITTVRDLVFTLSTLTAAACAIWWVLRLPTRAVARWWM